LRKIFPGTLIALAMFAGGTFALAGCVPGESAAGDAQPQRCFIMGQASDNFSREAQRTVFGAAKIPVSGEGLLGFYEASGLRRFLREKSDAPAAADQRLSSAAGIPLNVFSKFETASPFVRMFSIQVAVRK
jgi:hypothetical protein